MVRRRTRTVACGVLAAALVAGCGGDDRGAGDRAARTLNIHVSADLQVYPDAVRAAQLALEDADGRAGRFKVRLVVHDEASAKHKNTDPERIRRNAREAVRDPDAIAYVGDVNSGSTAISAPILNRAGMLQVTGNSTYVGLTRSEGAAPGEPGKYQPSGRPTLARVIPADHIQARASVVYARDLGVKRLGVISDDELYGRGLAKLVRAAARDLGLDAFGGGSGGDLVARARRATAAGADAVFVGTCGAAGEMLDLLESLAPAKVFAGDCYSGSSPRPLPHLNGRFFVTAPGGGLQKTEAGRRWFERWEERVGSAGDDTLMFAYEAMQAVLSAIERAGDDGDDRAAVVREFFATRDRDSILGRYSIDPYGDTTLRSYGGFAVRDGKLRFDRVLDTGG